MVNLEEKFKSLDLTEKEFKQLKSQVMRRYPDWKSYDIKDVQDLFQYNNINPRVISEEIRKIKNKRKNKKEWKVSGKKNPLLGAVLLGAVLGCVGLGVNWFVRENNENIAFWEVYSNAREKYGDRNGDGILTYEEGEEFERDVIKGKGVQEYYLNFALLRNFKGDFIDRKTITKWLEDYKGK